MSGAGLHYETLKSEGSGGRRSVSPAGLHAGELPLPVLRVGPSFCGRLCHCHSSVPEKSENAA